MIVTLINDSNLEFFMGAFTKETAGEADLLLGVIDDEDEYKACGGMALNIDDYGFRIISLYIAENKRRLGAATALLNYLDDLCEKEDIPGIRATYILDDETEGFCELLKSRGYTEDTDTGKSFIFAIGDVNLDVLPGRSKPPAGNISSLKKIDMHEWDAFCDRIYSERDALSEADRNVYPLLKDPDHYDRDMSYIYKAKDGSITGVLLSSISVRGYHLEYIWHENNDISELYALIATAAQNCLKLMPDAEISVYAANSEVEQLIRKLVIPESLRSENTIRQFKI